ncbi:hypothetical protein KEM52_002617 [Ascosphaera acerosa]|nr:hypothetical protein KEM52_002617 [Ascosphaera acerosa]
MRAGRHDSDSDSDSLAERANLLSDNGHGHGAAQAGRHEGTATAGNDADYDGDDDSGDSVDSSSTISASLAMMDRLNDEKRRLRRARDGGGGYTDDGGDAHHADSMDLDDLDFAAVERGTRGADVHGRDGDGDGDCRCCCSSASAATHASPSLRRRLAVWIAVALIATVCVVGVISAMLASRSASPVRPQGVGRPDQPLDSLEHSSSGNGTGTGTDTDTGNSTLKTITFDDAWRQEFRATSHSISWIAGPGGEDGLMLVRNLDTPGEHVCVEDVTTRVNGTAAATDGSRKTVLMQDRHFTYENQTYEPDEIWPNRGLTTLLLASGREKTWRHSFTAVYWLFDVATQTAQPLDPAQPYMRVQLASWSPAGDAVVFTRRNNMFLRRLGADDDGRVVQITHDGGPELFYGVPDWVYEEEVFTGNSVTWWSRDGRYVAFLRTNESAAPEYPVQYFLSSHSDDPSSGHSLENYPDTLQIKYPKAGAPNPVVTVQFYDVAKREVFSVAAADGAFADDDRLIIEVLWAGAGSVLVRETNRESDVVKVVLIDADARTAAVVRSQDLQALDGGWVEPSQFARYVPARPAAGRPHDGYVDIVVHENHNHLALFSPVNSSEPILLTRGDWEVVSAAPGVDVERGLVYFLAARDRPWKRHVYSVRLDGSDMQQLTDTSEDAYYAASFSQGAGYALLH